MKLDLKEKFREYRRIMSIARKPGKDEYMSTGKITAIGMLIIGAIGFLIFLLFIFLGI